MQRNVKRFIKEVNAMKKSFVIVAVLVFLLSLLVISCDKKEQAKAPGYGKQKEAQAGAEGEQPKQPVAGYGKKAQEAAQGAVQQGQQ